MSNDYDVVVVGGRVAGASTAMLFARAGARVALVDRAAYGTDTLSTHGLMRSGVVQLSRWGLLDERGRRGHAADPAHAVPLHRRRVRAGVDPPECRSRRAVRPAPTPPRPDPGRRGSRGRRRRAPRDDGDGAAARPKAAGCAASGSGAGPAAAETSRRDHGRRRRHPVVRRANRSARPSYGRAKRPVRCSTATSPVSRPTATNGRTALLRPPG